MLALEIFLIKSNFEKSKLIQEVCDAVHHLKRIIKTEAGKWHCTEFQ